MRAAALALAGLMLASGFAGLLAVASPEPEPPRAVRALEGKVRDAYGLLSAPQAGPPETIAAAYLKSHATQLGIPDAGQLRLASVRHSLTATHLRYEQLWQGLAVVGGEVSVHVARDGAVLAVHSRAVERVRALSGEVPADAAVASARSVAEGEPVGWEPVLLARGLEGVPVWQVSFHRALPLSAWVVHVDRSTGEVLAARDTVRAAEAPGQVWVNPIVASRNPDLRDNLAGVDRNPAPMVNVARTDLSPYVTDVSLTDLEEGPRGPVLVGPHARIADATASGADLRFPRHDPRFEEVNAYYWIDWSQRRIRELGFQEVASYQVPVYVHDQPAVFNAFYRGNGEGKGEIHFGWHAPTAALVGNIPVAKGFADAAEDAEVVLHEYGHAILDNQVPNFGSGAEGGAIHEGWGDFWEATQLSRVSNGTYDWCTAEWFTSYLMVTADGSPPCLRNLENSLTYDYESVDGHLTGQIWSGALWNLRKQLGREPMERLALEANFFLPLDGGFHAGAEALLMADAELHDAEHARLIVGEFKARNVTGLIVTPELLAKVQAAELRLASQEQPRAVPGPEAVLIALAAGLVGAVSRKRQRG